MFDFMRDRLFLTIFGIIASFLEGWLGISISLPPETIAATQLATVGLIGTAIVGHSIRKH